MSSNFNSKQIAPDSTGEKNILDKIIGGKFSTVSIIH